MECKKKYEYSTTYYRKKKVHLEKLKYTRKEIHQLAPEVKNLEDNIQTENTVTEVTTNAFVPESNTVQDSTKYHRNNPVDENKHDELTKSSKDELVVNNTYSLKLDLRNWAIEHKITHTAINSLLEILIGHGNNLPRDARSLLQTPRTVFITNIRNGQYWHNGLLKTLQESLQEINKPTTIHLTFNIDGLPLYNSSRNEFWPILYSIEEFPNIKPNIIGIFCGIGKPPLQEFITPFVEEMKDLLGNNFFINNHQIVPCIRCFVCDTPARSFIKGTVNFNHAHGCQKCTVEGEFYREGRHMSFPSFNEPRRTNESFRNRLDDDHHKEVSPIEQLIPINMVEDFPIADSLHLIDLGIMKKCLVGWVQGTFNFKTNKWTAREIEEISNLLLKLNSRMPSEIHRSVRGLDCLKYWKASEFRTFLLYLGIVVLKDYSRFDVYEHFLDFFCAITICSNPEYVRNHRLLGVAENLLQDYLQQYIKLYGIDSISMNVHNLCHLVEDVKKFGALPLFSAYQYENKLYQIKRLIRTGRKPLEQVVKRIGELTETNNGKHIQNKNLYPLLKNKLTINGKEVFVKLEVSKDLVFTNTIKDQWFLIKNQSIVKYIYALKNKQRFLIYGAELVSITTYFEKPFLSSFINIYKSDGQSKPPMYISIDMIKGKLVGLKYHNSIVFIRLLHSFDTFKC